MTWRYFPFWCFCSAVEHTETSRRANPRLPLPPMKTFGNAVRQSRNLSNTATRTRLHRSDIYAGKWRTLPVFTRFEGPITVRVLAGPPHWPLIWTACSPGSAPKQASTSRRAGGPAPSPFNPSHVRKSSASRHRRPVSCVLMSRAGTNTARAEMIPKRSGTACANDADGGLSARRC